jgi:hypothetical protein
VLHADKNAATLASDLPFVCTEVLQGIQMALLRMKARWQTSHQRRIASEREVRATFDSEHEHLFWLALLITADEKFATSAVVDAATLSTGGNHPVFHDWLVQWARSATIRSAAALLRSEFKLCAQQHKGMQCDHVEHAPLSKEQVESLHGIGHESIATLDPLARAVLVFRSIEHAALQDCALSLGVTRSDVTAAYCRALTWVSAQRGQYEEGHAETGVGAWVDFLPAQNPA